jgi:hypothetical protein
MTNAFKIRGASPAYPPKSGCGVPPQTVAGGVSPPVFRPQVDDFPPQPYFTNRRIIFRPSTLRHSDLRLFNFPIPNSAAS